MKSLVYVKSYKSRKSAPVEPENGRVYLAQDDGEYWSLILDEVATFTIHKNLCERITEQNVASYPFHLEDRELVTSYLSTELGIATAVNDIKEEDIKRRDSISDSLGMILALDGLMGQALEEVLSHVAKSYTDKYEDDGFPLVDIVNLKYNGGIVSSGFNVGNAIKYLKRYLTHGYDKSYNPQDLRKAIQFLLFELVNRQDEETKP
jgi:hypothetical protein